MSEIQLGAMVTAPVSDKDGEMSHVIGKLIAINSRMATIEQSDGTITKVGKTKIEALVEEVVKPKKGECPQCGESNQMYDFNHVKGRAAAKDAPYSKMVKRFWCQGCDHEWGGRVVRSEGTIDTKKYSYGEVQAASGRKSLDNGDETAQLLRGKTLIEVYHVASEVTGVNIDTLHRSYEHLNPGQQRMVLGNRVRKILKARAQSQSV